MGRVLSPYEIAWRRSVGHPVDDDDELERLTAPGGGEPAAVEQSAGAASTPVTSPVAPAAAPVVTAPAQPGKPTGKPAGK